MTDTDSVLVERDGPVTIVSINRPDCRNAVTVQRRKNCSTPSTRSTPIARHRSRSLLEPEAISARAPT
jgi:hypothetical protein